MRRVFVGAEVMAPSGSCDGARLVEKRVAHPTMLLAMALFMANKQVRDGHSRSRFQELLIVSSSRKSI